MAEQMDLALEREPTFDEALAVGWLRIQTEERELATKDGRVAYPFEPDHVVRALPADEPVTVVHVIHVPRRREIRGYVIARGELYERTPRPFAWPEMDAWVAEQLGVEVARTEVAHG